MKRSSRAGRLTQLERNQRTTGIFFILPSLVLCAIFMVVPLINVIRYSLTDWDGLSKTYNFVGLYNYMHLHEIEGFGEMRLATVTFAIGVTAITIIVSFLAALALAFSAPMRATFSIYSSLARMSRIRSRIGAQKLLISSANCFFI